MQVIVPGNQPGEGKKSIDQYRNTTTATKTDRWIDGLDDIHASTATTNGLTCFMCPMYDVCHVCMYVLLYYSSSSM